MVGRAGGDSVNAVLVGSGNGGVVCPPSGKIVGEVLHAPAARVRSLNILVRVVGDGHSKGSNAITGASGPQQTPQP